MTTAKTVRSCLVERRWRRSERARVGRRRTLVETERKRKKTCQGENEIKQKVCENGNEAEERQIKRRIINTRLGNGGGELSLSPSGWSRRVKRVVGGGERERRVREDSGAKRGQIEYREKNGGGRDSSRSGPGVLSNIIAKHQLLGRYQTSCLCIFRYSPFFKKRVLTSFFFLLLFYLSTYIYKNKIIFLQIFTIKSHTIVIRFLCCVSFFLN